jgi:DNA-binding transcriptional LysR family regulator
VRFAWTPGNTVDLFRAGEQVQVAAPSRFRVNNALAIREALLLGSGIGICPAWLISDLLDSGELVRVLADWSARHQDLHLLYPSRQYQPLRSRMFIDFSIRQLASLPGFQRPLP